MYLTFRFLAKVEIFVRGSQTDNLGTPGVGVTRRKALLILPVFSDHSLQVILRSPPAESLAPSLGKQSSAMRSENCETSSFFYFSRWLS
jgi:hypothetical protein